jgi:hypothetical protein
MRAFTRLTRSLDILSYIVTDNLFFVKTEQELVETKTGKAKDGRRKDRFLKFILPP